MADQGAVWKIDGTKVDTTPQTIAGQLLAAIPDLEFRSATALHDLFDNLLSLSIEMALIEKENKKGGERGALTRYINSISKQKSYIPTDRIKLLASLYDHILQSEGLGLLQGFGFENSKVGNAERTSNVIKLYTNEKENIMTTKKKETKEVVKIKRSELINTAKELNTVLEPDPEIEVGLPSEELIPILVEAAKLLEPGDKISAVTQKVLDNLPEAEDPAEEQEKEKELSPEEITKIHSRVGKIMEEGGAGTPEKEESEKGKKEPEKEESVVAEPEKAAGKKKTTSAKEKSPAAKDEFGFTIGSKPNLFANSLKEKPGTMKEICSRDWNDREDLYYNALKKMREFIVVEKDETTKVLSIKVSK
jgi:hypothetical protein